MLAIDASGLSKSFGDVVAVDGLDLHVTAGTIYGLLGPNGAGKTTTIKMLATLLPPDSGTAQVIGHDIVRAPQEVRAGISMTGQFATVDESLTGLENLVLIGRLLGFGRARARSRAEELLAAFGMADEASMLAGKYSGGMARRIDIAASLIVPPELLFLDEPTANLDPRSRHQVWTIVKELAASGTTIVLTSHYLDEVDQLADRVAVIDHGRLIAEGTNDELKSSVGAGTLQVSLADPHARDAAERVLGWSLGVPPRASEDSARVSAQVSDERAATSALAALSDAGVDVVGFSLARPTLDEAFLALTGQPTGAGSPRAGDDA